VATSAQVTEVHRLSMADVPILAIAKETGLTHGQVNHIRTKMRMSGALPRGKGGRKFVAGKYDHVKDMIRSGASSAQIVATCKISPSTVARLRKEMSDLAEPEETRQAKAMYKMIAILGDGQWHEKETLSRTLKISVSEIILAATFQALLAESDSGAWMCIPDDRTPELAPDGT